MTFNEVLPEQAFRLSTPDKNKKKKKKNKIK